MTLPYNPILDNDSYKLSHFNFYVPGMTEMYSYLEARGGRYEKTMFYGLNPILKRLATKLEPWMVDEAEEFAELHGEPFNRKGWDDILELGYLPLEIKAVKEGTLVNTRNVMITIRNTDPRFGWLTSAVETPLLRVWYPTTVATRIHYMKQKMLPFFERTGTVENLEYSLVDFSSRGVTCHEQSVIGGGAHLIHFKSSDNIPAIRSVNHEYGIKMAGFSVPATEHSIMCSFGPENEFESFKHIINKTKDGGIVSVVSDTWDIFNACEMWGKLAEEIKRRNITLVVRPDSGEIEDVLPRVLTILRNAFGATKNAKGYDVLNNVKVLWGDGIDENTATGPYGIAERMGISADSIVIGSGGGLMQVDINRDTCKFAVKGSNVIVNGVEYPIAKDPITDKGKRSKKGKMKLYLQHSGNYFTYTTDNHPIKYSMEEYEDSLQTVFLNGKIMNESSWDDIRSLANEGLKITEG